MGNFEQRSPWFLGSEGLATYHQLLHGLLVAKILFDLFENRNMYVLCTHCTNMEVLPQTTMNNYVIKWMIKMLRVAINRVNSVHISKEHGINQSCCLFCLHLLDFCNQVERRKLSVFCFPQLLKQSYNPLNILQNWHIVGEWWPVQMSYLEDFWLGLHSVSRNLSCQSKGQNPNYLQYCRQWFGIIRLFCWVL